MAVHHDIEKLLRYIEDNASKIEGVSMQLQKEAYDLLRAELLNFETKDGKFVATQDLRKRLIAIEDKLEAIIGSKVYKNTIDEYLLSFEHIQALNIKMQQDYNNLKVPDALITPTRQMVYQQAKDGLIKSLAKEYVQPAKYLMMQQVTGGATISHGLLMLERWNSGDMTDGRYSTEPTPNLQKYATQLARDAAYSFDRNINSVIKDKYELNGFIYAGSIIKDTRPLCAQLIMMNRPILYNEIAPLLVLYPQGLIAGTNTNNFTQFCGGYNCRHRCFPTRVKVVK